MPTAICKMLSAHASHVGSAVCARWAQDLGGMDFVATLPATTSPEDKASLLDGLSVYRRQQRVEVLLERLQCSKMAAAALK